MQSTFHTGHAKIRLDKSFQHQCINIKLESRSLGISTSKLLDLKMKVNNIKKIDFHRNPKPTTQQMPISKLYSSVFYRLTNISVFQFGLNS